MSLLPQSQEPALQRQVGRVPEQVAHPTRFTPHTASYTGPHAQIAASQERHGMVRKSQYMCVNPKRRISRVWPSGRSAVEPIVGRVRPRDRHPAAAGSAREGHEPGSRGSRRWDRGADVLQVREGRVETGHPTEPPTAHSARRRTGARCRAHHPHPGGSARPHGGSLRVGLRGLPSRTARGTTAYI